MLLMWGTSADWKLQPPRRPLAPSLGAAWVGPGVLVAATIAGWWAFADTQGDEANAGLALFMGSVSILLMTWSNLLSTRWRLLEPLFGGLDRAYRWHRWFGIASVVAMWLHIQWVDDVEGVPGARESIADTAEALAGTAETLLYILIVVSVLRWIPYRWWRLTHKAMVVPYALACWHFYTATKPFGNGEAWGRWFSTLMIVGLASWLYRVVWRDVVRRGVAYRVRSVDQVGTLTHLVLTPLGRRRIDHRPGQFVVLSPQVRGLAEPHPFTIASPPAEPDLRFHIRHLGDWTDRLGTRLAPGDRVNVEGPYGRLHPQPRHASSPLVWIAGGVGITPFLSAALGTEPAPGAPVPHLFYAVRSRSDAVALEQLERAARNGRITLHLRASDESQRLGERDLVDTFGPDGLAGAHVVMCGPASLVRDMTRAARRLGARRVHVEAFDFRGGLGPDLSRQTAAWWSKKKSPQAVRPGVFGGAKGN